MGTRCSAGSREAATAHLRAHRSGGRTGAINLFEGVRDDWGYCLAKHIAVLGVIATLLLNWIADEAKAWLPWCARRFFDLSVRLLPASERERYSEEWRGHIESFPGAGLTSAQFVLAALEIRAFLMKEALLYRWMKYRTHTAVIGLLAYCWLNVQMARIFGTQKPVTREYSVENSNLAIAALVILIAFVMIERSREPQPTGMA
jgi:hypothetical protein